MRWILNILRQTRLIVGYSSCHSLEWCLVHVGDTHSHLRDILSRMRPGDELTHYLHPDHHGVLDEKGKMLPEVLVARQRNFQVC